MCSFLRWEKTAEINPISQLKNITHTLLNVPNRSDWNVYANNQHSGEPVITSLLLLNTWSLSENSKDEISFAAK